MVVIVYVAIKQLTASDVDISKKGRVQNYKSCS
jgi:hypothetical protein